MVQALRKTTTHFFFGAVLLLLSGANSFAQQDPPARVARLNYTSGNVSMEPAGVDDWAPAIINRPFTIGDYLYTDQGARAELHLDIAAIRMGSQTSFGFLNLDDRTVQIKLTEGDLYIRVHNFTSDQVFEVDTPNAAVTLLSDGVYRFRVDANGNMSYVVVRQGQAQVTGGGQAFTLNTGNSANLNGTDQLSYDIEVAPNPDDFDNWCAQRDAHEAHLASARYLPPTVIGYEDLDDYGSWQQTPEYGPVWYPQSVNPGWAPYQYGHWAWIDPWGWTWVDSAPWGFAPFHYGRWVYSGTRWGWCPGPVSVEYRGPVVRPWYAPALVAFFGGSHWGVGISAGGPSLGWVPLGWGEVYTPAYHCSPRYFNNVNVYNTPIVNNVNITNVYNTVYVNKQVYNQTFVNARVPNAVVAMPQSAFASGRTVRQAAVPVRQLNPTVIQSARVIAPPVAPTRQAVTPMAAGGQAVRPPAQIAQRQVVARNTPPAPAPTFAAQQQYLQQHVQQNAGQPINYAAIRQAAAPRATPTALVRPAPPARPVEVHPGTRVGNVTAASRPGAPQTPTPQRPANATAPAPMQPGARPGQPAAETPRAVQPQAPARTEQERPVAPAAHGVPPNMRQAPGQPPQGGRYEQGTQNVTPNRQVTAQPSTNQRAPQYPAQTQRQTPAPGTQRNTAPAAQPQYHQQPQNTRPAPERVPPPTTEPRQERTEPTYQVRPENPPRTANRPEIERRPAPAPRTENQPAQRAEPRQEQRPAEHGTPPNREQHSQTPQKSDHPKDDHKDQR